MSLLVQGGERIALLGDNGAGKTTFIRCLLGQESCEGKIKFGPTVRVGYLPQIMHFSHPERSLYRMQLLEVFSAFDRHLERVVELLRPIAAVLPDYMAPWTRQIPALAEQWDTFFQGNSAQEFFLQRARIQSGEFRELRLAFRFFSPYGSPGKFLGEKGRLLFHMGVNMQPGLGNAGQAQAPEEWELTALRLMANGSRMEMLHAMAERPMSGQELAQKLNLNSGSVFRDLNSLYNARLLLMESTGGRNCYRTNLPVVRNMMERMLNYLQNQG